MSQNTVIDISTIQLLPEFIVRSQAVDPETVERYRAMLDRLPRIKVWQHPETGQLFLVDGRHTLEAHRAEAQAQVEATVVDGDYDDALVQARAGNLSHGRPYSRAEWRQAVTDIVKIRYLRTNAWIAREAGCSAPTIARLRAELEQAGVIPCLEVLEAEGGRMVQRQAKEAESPAPEVSDIAEEIGVDTAQAEPGREQKRRAQPEAPDPDPGLDPPARVTVKLGRLGPALAAEVGLWVDGQSEPIPVTLLIAAGRPRGLEAAAPGHDSCLIIGEALARNLKLVFE